MPAEIFLYDVIGQDWFGEGCTAKKLRDELAGVDSGERLLVRINSPGGLVFEAATMMAMLAEHKGGVDVQIDGLAASAASYIAMVGETIAITAGGMMMIHDPWSIVMGDARDMRAEAELLDKIAVNLVDAYARKSGKPTDEIRSAMLAETWYTADEAIDFGLADEKIETVAAKACVIPQEFPYKNAPRPQSRSAHLPVKPGRAAAMARQIKLARLRAES
jgi:ATP-dependent Clp protease protease subunit